MHAYGKRQVEEVISINPDLIISDFPPLEKEQHGWQFLQMPRMKRETAHIPVVVCTTNLRAIEDNQAWMVSKGMRVVAKPFDVDELYMAIETLIGKADEPGPGPAATATSSLAGTHHTTTEKNSRTPDTSPAN
ncbi:MAG: response regulator [Chloroflexota bacterium]|nr:response regulator [Chloroflexota bacterium]